MKRALVLAAVVACDQGTGLPRRLPDSDGAPYSPSPIGAPCGFSQTAFALPTVSGVSSPPFGALSGQSACASSSGSLSYELADVDGDAKLDLVVTSACDDASVGRTGLLVYPNLGASFGAPVRYDLPAIAGTPGCASFALLDVDGDLHLDLLATSLCTDASVGTSHWLLFRNTGANFDTSGQSYALPPGAAAASFPALSAASASCGAGKPAYGFYDLDGDKRPDLVVTTACDDVSVGVTHWRVYPGSATGVGAPLAFSLPGGADFFGPTSGEVSCQAGLVSPRYAVVDLDGDLAPEIVVTKRCNDGDTGTAHWLVFANQKKSFASTATSVALPGFAGAPAGAYESLSGTAPCTTGALTHALVDVDGDLRPDLVVTRACGDAATGVSQWLVHPGTGTAFGAAKGYALPASLGATASSPAAALAGTVSCSGGGQQTAFATAHLLGAPLDVVLTSACTDPAVGVARWLVAAPSCH